MQILYSTFSILSSPIGFIGETCWSWSFSAYITVDEADVCGVRERLRIWVRTARVDLNGKWKFTFDGNVFELDSILHLSRRSLHDSIVRKLTEQSLKLKSELWSPNNLKLQASGLSRQWWSRLENSICGSIHWKVSFLANKKMEIFNRRSSRDEAEKNTPRKNQQQHNSAVTIEASAMIAVIYEEIGKAWCLIVPSYNYPASGAFELC